MSRKTKSELDAEAAAEEQAARKREDEAAELRRQENLNTENVNDGLDNRDRDGDGRPDSEDGAKSPAPEDLPGLTDAERRQIEARLKDPTISDEKKAELAARDRELSKQRVSEEEARKAPRPASEWVMQQLAEARGALDGWRASMRHERSYDFLDRASADLARIEKEILIGLQTIESGVSS